MKIGLIVQENSSGYVDWLEQAGHTVVICALAGTMPEQLSALAGLLVDSESFDLIHNRAGQLPLLFAPLWKAPLITTLPSVPDRELLAACEKCRGAFFWISTGWEPDGIELLGRSVRGGSDREVVLAAYEKVARLSAREDHRPWGWYEVLSSERSDHKLKRITVNAGQRLSLQRHHKRREHWFIVSGCSRVVCGDDEIELKAGQSVDIQQGMVHRIENTGHDPLVFIEVQQGDYLGEDDIERLHDDYGRE